MCSRGSVGREVCFVAVGHVEGCRRVRSRKMMGERWVNQKYLANKLADCFLPQYFVCPSSMMYLRGFGGRMGWEVSVGWLAVDGRWGGEKSKFSWAHQNISSKSLMPSTSHLLFLSATSRRCIWEATGVGSCGGWPWGRWRSMPWRRVGATRGESMFVFSKSLVSISK
jgi:hypothetical protein